MAAALALSLLLLLGLVERRERDRCWAAVPLRIHVNGTRGKSTVTRLIRGALAEAGIRAVAKTTGTEARLILPDGTERPVRRWAPPSIREQLWALRMARRVRAQAAVLECLAVRPDLQWVAEHRMVGAGVGVLTNVRPDHAEVMGHTLSEIAASLANTVPRRGMLVTGDARFLSVFRERAAALGTEVRVAEPLPPALREAAGVVPDWWAEDAAVALAVTRALEIPDGVALAGMLRATPDPGAARELTLAGGLKALDASAANDPESLLALLAGLAPSSRRLLFLYNHRSDRPARLRTFLAAGLPGEVVLTGDPPGPILHPPYVPPNRLTAWLEEWRAAGVGMPGAACGDGPEAPLVVLCGNAKGLRLRRGEGGTA